jgi:hypothetical protein
MLEAHLLVPEFDYGCPLRLEILEIKSKVLLGYTQSAMAVSFEMLVGSWLSFCLF